MSFELPLCHIADIEMGQSPSGDSVNEQGLGFPLLNGPTEFTSRYPIPVQYTEAARKISKTGDILFCVRGSTTGRMNYADKSYAIGRGLAAIRGKNGYPTSYIKVILEQNLDKLLASATGSTFPNIGRDLLANFKIQVLPEYNAKLISQFIDAIDCKIHLNNQINQTLESIAQAMFKSWFIDFDPVKAKIAAKLEDKNLEIAAMCVISGKTEAELKQMPKEDFAELQTTAALFPDELVESELGEVPREWVINNISDMGKVVTGKTPSSNIENAFEEEGIPFITPSDIYESLFVISTSRFLSKGGQDAIKNTKIIAGSICVTCIGSQMGKVVVSPYNAFTNQQINSIILPKIYFRNYLLLNLRRRREEIFLIGSSGSTMPIINKSTFEKLKIVIPSKFLLERFDSFVGPFIDKILQGSLENIRLTTIRDTLLPKLLSGEMGVE